MTQDDSVDVEGDVDGEPLFWDLVEPMFSDPAVTRSTMMGLPCVRLDGRFFASLDHRTKALLVKLPPGRVADLVAGGVGVPFAPAGRTFREWVALPRPDEELWRDLLAEAKTHVAGEVLAPIGPRFAGFGLTFLAGLADTNTRTYFDAGRDAYRRELLEPSKAFVTALADTLRPRIDGLRVDPRVGGSLFRIANDVRFNRDQPPYKPHVDMALWVGDAGPRTDPALLIRLTPEEVHLGTGVFLRAGPALDRYRAALHDPVALAELDGHVDALTEAGATVSPPTRRRPPAGFPAGGTAAQWAIRDGFHVMRIEQVPPVVNSAGFVDWCAERLTPLGSVLHWLVEHTTPAAVTRRR
ncbi:DUF2461 family protein [Dactylosporangium sp. CA-139114]|uniref:DUF2461 family protein n=1 Tax=Dactylosporangium sp. CA-139114 TaxID=3239931 RepID=UPI003D99BEEF